MSVGGYLLILNEDRFSTFQRSDYNKFAEPVPEFTHSKNVPLVCFISDKSGNITHIGLGRRGVRAGTELRRLNIEDIFELKGPISAIEIAKKTGSRVRSHLINRVRIGGLFAPKGFEEFLDLFLGKAPESAPLLSKYSSSRGLRISKLSRKTQRSLAEQKEAVLTAMNIAGIDRKTTLGWNYIEEKKPKSYLEGLSQVRLREDSIVINDLTNFPGLDLIETTTYSSSVFENNNTRLTVLLANRLPLEELLGTDLIYYNEDFKSFIMVQYKCMEHENGQDLYRLPDKQLAEETLRMDSIMKSLKSINGNGIINDYRFNENPFFVKICPRLVFDPDNTGLSTGMYIPLDYIKLLENDKCIEGVHGGKAIKYENVGRYLNNTQFKTIVESGWIGTNQNQSLMIEKLIKDTLENGKAAVIAIKKQLNNLLSYQPGINNNLNNTNDLPFQ